MHNTKIALFTRYSRLGASSRLRFFQFLPALEKEFHINTFALFDDEYLHNFYAGKQCSKRYVAFRYLQRFFQLLTLHQYDLIWIEKELFPFLPAWAERYLSFIQKTYIVDYDDAIFHNYDLTSHPLKKILSTKIDQVMHAATCVTAGNDYLADRAIKSGAKKVKNIPTVIDLDRYSVLTDNSSKRLSIGWIGSSTTAKYLHLIAPALKKLAMHYNFTLRVVGADIEINGVNVVCIDWTEDTEVSEIQKFDIGIMPLADSPWEKGKCGYKLIQYMACGIPVIASPVGVNTEIVNESAAGFLAENDDQWFRYFDQLFSNTQLRRELGAKGRLAVEQLYSIQVIAPRLTALFKDLHESQ